MKKTKLSLCLTLSINILISAIGLVIADTGTYKLLNYKVKLTPKSDGLVTIEYYQKWSVESGSIPWITVGVPNGNFSIVAESSKGAIKNIAPENSGGWSGVKIDLDKDYQPGETFEVWFTIEQNNLFYADETNYKMDFTPGWYDNAFIDNMEVEVFFFASMDSVAASPETFEKQDQSIIWKKGLGKGERFEILVSFPKNLFPTEIPQESLKQTTDLSGGTILVIVILAIIILVVLLFFLSLLSDGSGGSYGGGGSIFFGGSGGDDDGGISSGGGGGFGGRSSSCDCACVSCACACACAGGGAAGCDRKLDFHKKCKTCKEVSCAFKKALEKFSSDSIS